MFRKIMVAYDESSEAGRALRASIELAKTLSAELRVVSVLEPPPGYYSFAVSAIPAFHWTEEKRVKYCALQAEARQQATAAGVVLDAELIGGDGRFAARLRIDPAQPQMEKLGAIDIQHFRRGVVL
jgi:nucleotide-binding universal stress UspA family protein